MALSAAAPAESEVLSGDRADGSEKLFVSGEIQLSAVDTGAPDFQAGITAATPATRSRTTREIPDDDQRVQEALASGDLPSMNTLLEDICDPVLRNRLLNPLVTSLYRLRSDSKHRDAFYRVADLQIEEAPSILEGIKEIGMPRPASIEAFRTMAIALDEDGHQDAAIAVCELALSLGLEDGTKSGFRGRISRLKNKSQGGADCPDKVLH
jgi:hypothetical protein